MTKTLEEIIAQLPLERQKKIETRAQQLIAEEITRRNLRKAHELTQVE
jgi:hypothetical protein